MTTNKEYYSPNIVSMNNTFYRMKYEPNRNGTHDVVFESMPNVRLYKRVKPQYDELTVTIEDCRSPKYYYPKYKTVRGTNVYRYVFEDAFNWDIQVF